MMTKSVENTWKLAFDEVKKYNALDNDAIGLFAIQLRFKFDDFKSVAAESITGGNHDKKCDLVYVDKEHQCAVIAQCYVSKKKIGDAPSNKAADLGIAINWLLSAEIDSLPSALKGRADELRTAITSGEIKQFYIWYVHNLTGSKNVKDELRVVEIAAKKILDSYENGKDIAVFGEKIDSSELNRLFTENEKTLLVLDNFEIRVKDAIEINNTNWTTVTTTVPGLWLYELYHKYEKKIFSANLRDYLGSITSDSNINHGIKLTAQKEPNNFYVYNNGITALVKDFILGPRTKSGRKFNFNGISIVNGAQTTGSIGSLDREPSPDLQVLVRFVKYKKESIIADIVRYNNSQNKLQAADFRSGDAIQERLRKEFESIPDADYEGGRRGGASDGIKRSKYSISSYTVGQSLAAFHGNPVGAYDKKSEIWKEEKSYRQVFTDRTTAKHIVFCYSLLLAINEYKIMLIKKQKETEAPLLATETKHLEFLAQKGANYLLIFTVSQCMETILAKAIANKFDLQFKRNISPSNSVKIWRPIIEIILALSNQLDGAFSRNRISNENKDKVVPKFVGIIESLKEAHKESFKKFADQVKI